MTAQLLYAADGLRRSHMGQRRTVHDVADGIDTLHVGAVEVVHLYLVALKSDSGFFESESFEVRFDADGRKDDVGGEYLFAFLAFDAEFAFPLAVHRNVFHGGSRHDSDLHFAEGTFECLAHVGVGCGKQLREIFDHRDLHAQRGVEISEFATDGTGTDYRHALGELAQHEGLFGRDDLLAVDRHEFHFARTGAGRQDDVRGFHSLFLAVGPLYFHRAFSRKTAVSADNLDAVLFHQERHALAHRVGHSPAAVDDFVERCGDLSVYLDAVVGGMLGIIVNLGAFQQGLGGDAPPVQAHATQLGPLHYGGFQSVLCGFDRGNVPSGAAAYYDNIVFHLCSVYIVLIGIRVVR